jgi:Universal stress protein family
VNGGAPIGVPEVGLHAGTVGRGSAGRSRRPIPDPPQRILLASTGVPFPGEAVDRAASLATPEHAKITVLSIARVWGTSLGIPHPGLQPTPAEWEAQRRIVNQAAGLLRRRGFEVRVALSRSRKAPKMISKWTLAKNFHAVVMVDPDVPRWRRVVEGDACGEVERRTGVPVHRVPFRRAQMGARG